ncbi:MAG TPA: acetyltransferase [Dehalococcoidia bacterium]|nr:acetyltransferase [Dehalococcoidia bacterium]
MTWQREPVLIYGAGGHARVVVDMVELQERHTIAGLLDDRQELWGQRVMGYPVLGGFETLREARWQDCKLIIAVGGNAARQRLAEKAASLGFQFATAIHPSAQIARDVAVGPGTVVMANTAVNPGSAIGAHVIINTGASADHDNVVEDFAHISVGVHLGGEVRVGCGALLGVGVSVGPQVCIGRWAIVGIGAAVIQDIPDYVTAVGVPAKPIKVHQPPETKAEAQAAIQRPQSIRKNNAQQGD